MLDKLKSLEEKYLELSEMLSQPDTVSDLSRYQKLSKALSDLTDIVNAYRDYKEVLHNIEEAESLLRENLESDFRELVEQELDENRERKADLERMLQMLLLPKDPNDDKNVIMEIRAGTGGEEAALFAATLFRMYSRYAERQGW